MVGEINMVCEKTLSDFVALFLGRESVRNLDTTLKLMFARTEVGAAVAKGRMNKSHCRTKRSLPSRARQVYSGRNKNCRSLMPLEDC
jgi:hypothetical protein